MGGGSAPRVIVVEDPLTGAQLVKCARAVVIKLVSGGSAMVRMIERDELEAMAREAVLLADRKYRPYIGVSRQTSVIGKGVFLIMDMMRHEARHTICLSTNEFRGVILDDKGNRIEPRAKISLNASASSDNDNERDPTAHSRATVSPLWMTTYDQQLYNRFDRALDRLPDERAATAFRLIVWHEWTQTEVAELFGIHPTRVSQMLTRARVRLRAEFSDLTPNQRTA